MTGWNLGITLLILALLLWLWTLLDFMMCLICKMTIQVYFVYWRSMDGKANLSEIRKSNYLILLLLRIWLVKVINSVDIFLSCSRLES